jgi:hypothetical protein
VGKNSGIQAKFYEEADLSQDEEYFVLWYQFRRPSPTNRRHTAKVVNGLPEITFKGSDRVSLKL